MITMDDYFKAPPHERAFVDSLKPPLAHTHRGSIRSWALEGHHNATKKKRTPTHRADTTPRVPDWARHLLAANGKDGNG